MRHSFVVILVSFSLTAQVASSQNISTDSYKATQQENSSSPAPLPSSANKNGRFSLYLRDLKDKSAESSTGKEIRLFGEAIKEERKDFPSVYNNHLNANTFMGNPVLIDLGDGTQFPAAQTDEIEGLKSTVTQLSDAKTALKALGFSDTDDEINKLKNLAANSLSAEIFSTQKAKSFIPHKYLLVFNYNIPALKRGWPLQHNYSAVVLDAHLYVTDKDDLVGSKKVSKIYTVKSVSPTVREMLSTANLNQKTVETNYEGKLTPKLFSSKVDLKSAIRKKMTIDQVIQEKIQDEKSSDEKSSVSIDYPSPVNIVSIYPTSQILSASLVNSRSLALSGSGGYMGANVSATYTTSVQESYMKSLPKLVGAADSYGHIQWICYPAKAQQISFGNHSGFVVFTIPGAETVTKASNFKLTMDVRLAYKLKGIDSLRGEVARVERLTIPLNMAVDDSRSIEMFSRTYGRTLPVEDEIQLQRLLRYKDPSSLLKSKKADEEKSK